MALDLHGLIVHHAWENFRSTTNKCYYNNIKKLTVITGHGIMSTEFRGWVEADPYSLRCETQNPNTGSWTVYIKKNESIKKQVDAVDLTGLYKKFNK